MNNFYSRLEKIPEGRFCDKSIKEEIGTKKGHPLLS